VPAVLSDEDIDVFIAEPKILLGNLRLSLLRDKLGHREADFHQRGEAGSEFHIRIRQSRLNVLERMSKAESPQ
jgi:hypothetical protein